MHLLLLDLEGTVIDTVHHPVLLSKNIPLIKKLAREANAVGIFSFAVRHKDDFGCRDVVNSIVSLSDDWIIPVDKMKKAASGFRKFGSMMSDMDFFDFWGDKVMVLTMYARTVLFWKGVTKVTLVDDTVPDAVFTFGDKSIHFVRV